MAQCMAPGAGVEAETWVQPRVWSTEPRGRLRPGHRSLHGLEIELRPDHISAHGPGVPGCDLSAAQCMMHRA